MIYSAFKLSSPTAEAALCSSQVASIWRGLASKYAGIAGHICRPSAADFDQQMIYPSSRLHHCSVSFASDASLFRDRWAGVVECEG
jgi:hypothetical protein